MTTTGLHASVFSLEGQHSTTGCLISENKLIAYVVLFFWLLKAGRKILLTITDMFELI